MSELLFRLVMRAPSTSAGSIEVRFPMSILKDPAATRTRVHATRGDRLDIPRNLLTTEAWAIVQRMVDEPDTEGVLDIVFTDDAMTLVVDAVRMNRTALYLEIMLTSVQRRYCMGRSLHVYAMAGGERRLSQMHLDQIRQAHPQTVNVPDEAALTELLRP